ncbi:MAG: DUF4136 domain-containing protein [Candidatus Acidiferrum sp.]
MSAQRRNPPVVSGIAAPSRKTTGCLAILLLVCLCASRAAAKTAIDFNPNLDFSQFKTFAYIGGVEQLLKLQLNPDLLNNRIYRAVTRELTTKGLREVKPEENPDLVVRYWVNGQTTDINVSSHANWGIYGSYYGYHWGYIYYSMDASTTHLGTLGIELINARSRDLAWRMFASAKLYHSDPDKIWKTADGNIKKAFKSYPPSAKAIETTKARWAKEDAAAKTGQP